MMVSSLAITLELAFLKKMRNLHICVMITQTIPGKVIFGKVGYGRFLMFLRYSY